MYDLARLAASGVFDQADSIARPFGGQWIGPPLFLVERVPQGVEGGLITRRRDVQAAPAGQLHARRHEMQFDAALVGVADPENVALVRFKPREGQLFESVHRKGLLVFARRILRGKRHNARAIGPFMRRGVDQRFGPLGRAPQDFRQGLARPHDGGAILVAQNVAIVGIGDDLASDEIADRPGAAALAVRKELDQHVG